MSTGSSKLQDDRRRLYSTQFRLRHLKSVSARNVVCDPHHVAPLGLYFTLHREGCTREFYRSEVRGRTENPNWKCFNWAAATSEEDMDTALSCVILKLWSSSVAEELLSEEKVVFRDLQFVGEQIPRDGLRFLPNSLLFEMFEGFYAAAVWKGRVGKNVGGEEEAAADDGRLLHVLMVSPSVIRKSYDWSTLKRVQTVQRAIKETRAAVHRARTEIHRRLVATLDKSEMMAGRKLLQVRLEQLREELAYHRQCLQRARQRCAEAQENNDRRACHLRVEGEALRTNAEQLVEQRKNLIDTRENLIKTAAQLSLRRRQLVSELGFVYPIHEGADKAFTICGVRLPDSEDFTGHDELMISTALGYVAHLVSMISQFHQVPLRYPVVHGGSRSKVFDLFLSTIPHTDREFPLYTRGTDKLHFKYGVYLVNKNVAQLRYLCGFNTFDLRCTLANLKTLLEPSPVTKMELTTPVPMMTSADKKVAKQNAKDIIRFQEDASGSTDSLNLDTARHRRPLWRPSPECCRSAPTSVSLDQGLDELDFGATGSPLGTAELCSSEPSLPNAAAAAAAAVIKNGVTTTVAPLGTYGSESEPDNDSQAKSVSETLSLAPSL